jgi:hypothetical protein
VDEYCRFELTNPENLPTPQFVASVRMIFDQCLCCLMYHPEVWLSYSRFEAQQNAGIIEARTILRDSISIIPKASFLRIALAELEEQQGNFDAAREVLRSAFQSLPSGFTFSVLQRFIRRRDGMHAARKCFSETAQLRRDKKLGSEVCCILYVVTSNPLNKSHFKQC